MTLHRIPLDSNNERQHRTIIATTVNELVKVRPPHDRTEAEVAAGVTPLDYGYAPGDIRRIDHAHMATLQGYIEACADAGIVLDCFNVEITPTVELTLPSDTYIRGGVWKKTNTSTRLFTNDDHVGGNENITLDAVTFDGQHNSFGGNNGIYFENVTNVTVMNCHIKDLHSSLSGIVKFNPLWFVDCQNVFVKDNRMIEAARSGVYINGVSGRCIVTGNYIEKIENAGIVIQGTNDDGTDPVEEVVVANNIVVDAHNGAYDAGAYTGDQLYNQDGAIDVYSGGNNVVVVGNVIDGFGIFGNDEQAVPGGADDNDGDGIRLTQCEGAVVVGNTLVTHANFDVCLYAGVRNSVASLGLVFAHNSVIVRGEGFRGFVTQQSNVTFQGNHFRADAVSAEFLVGIDLRGTAHTGVQILDNISDVPCTSAGIRLEGDGTECRINGNRVTDCERGISTTSGETYTRCQFNNNTFPSTTDRGIYIQGTAFDCQIRGNTLEDSGASAIQVVDGDRCLISDNVISNAGVHGIILQAGDRTVIQNNIVTASSQNSSNSSDNINVTGDNILVQGNMVYQGAGANVSRHGIRVNAGSNKVAVMNNFVEAGGSTSEISDAGTGTITTSGNVT